jgi:signal transduction histidine kinase
VAQSGDRGAPSPVYSRVAAAVLTERFDEILEDYERRLLGMDSFVIVGEGSGTGAREAQARSMASRAAAILRGEDASALETEEEIYRNIEASREPLNPHADEAFRAGEAFCGAALSAIARHLPPETPPEDIVGISLAVEEVVTQRIARVLMASYIDYLMTNVRETRSEERRRFSCGLHDRLAHDVASVRANLELYEELIDTDPGRARGRLDLPRRDRPKTALARQDFSRSALQQEQDAEVLPPPVPLDTRSCTPFGPFSPPFVSRVFGGG